MTGISEQDLDRVLRDVVKRTITDADFRAKALADGTAAVAEVAGKNLGGQKFVFVENTADTRTIILPDSIGESDQLLDEDLEQVAGGVSEPIEACNGTCGQGSCLHT